MRIAEAVASTMDTSQQASELKAARRRAEQAKKGLDGILDAVQDGMPYAAVKDRMEGLTAMKEDAERDIERLKDAMEFDVATFGQFLMHGCGLDDRALLDAFVYLVIVEEEQVTAILNACTLEHLKRPCFAAGLRSGRQDSDIHGLQG